MNDLDNAEVAHAEAVSGDMDLMIRARELTGDNDRTPKKETIQKVHQMYPGGISQFYLHNRF